MTNFSRFNRDLDTLRYKGQALRAAPGDALAIEDLRRVTPSLFSETRAEHLSSRYTQIPTIDVLSSLLRDGWQMTFAAQAKARAEDGREHTRHMVRLRQPGEVVLNQDYPEVVLYNSHNGSSAFRLLAGFMRLICKNGLIVGQVDRGVSVPHRGNVIEGVRAGAHAIAHELTSVAPMIEDMRTTSLNRDESRLFARHALALRFDADTTASVDDALHTRRFEDRPASPNLWTTFNVVQENVIRGGIRAERTNEAGEVKRTKARAVGAVDRDLKLNTQLFALAREFHALKRGTSTIDLAQAA